MNPWGYAPSAVHAVADAWLEPDAENNKLQKDDNDALICDTSAINF